MSDQQKLLNHSNVEYEILDDNDDVKCKGQERQRRTSCSSANTIIFFAGVYLGRVCQGLYLAIFSPTLLYLAENVDQSVASISPMLTGNSFGFMIGSISAGFFLKWKNPLIVIAFGLAIISVILFAIPFVTSVYILIPIVSLNGLMAGNLDGVLQGIILSVWGEKHSRIHIQSFHFAFTIGAFFAPVIAKPFLEMASLSRKQNARCPHQNYTEDDVFAVVNDSLRNETSENIGLNPIAYVYVISSVFVISVSIFFFILSCLNVTEKIKKQRRDENYEVEEREEEPLRKVLCLFILVSVYYFCLIGVEAPFIVYLFAVAVCSEMHYSESNASLLTSLYWGCFGTGRLVGVPASKYLNPQQMIVVSLTGSFLSMLTIALLGQSMPWIMWLGTASLAFFLGPLYPTGVSWVSRLCNISGKYVFILNFGASLGAMINLFVDGLIFQQSPFSVIYVITGMVGSLCVTFSVMTIYGRTRMEGKNMWKISYKEEDTDIVEMTELINNSDDNL